MHQSIARTDSLAFRTAGASPSGLGPPAAMDDGARVRNTGHLGDYTRALRGAIQNLDPAKFAAATDVMIIEMYEDFMVDLLKTTGRPVKSLLAKACQQVYGTEMSDAKVFAERLGKCKTYGSYFGQSIRSITRRFTKRQ